MKNTETSLDLSVPIAIIIEKMVNSVVSENEEMHYVPLDHPGSCSGIITNPIDYFEISTETNTEMVGGPVFFHPETGKTAVMHLPSTDAIKRYLTPVFFVAKQLLEIDRSHPEYRQLDSNEMDLINAILTTENELIEKGYAIQSTWLTNEHTYVEAVATESQPIVSDSKILNGQAFVLNDGNILMDISHTDVSAVVHYNEFKNVKMPVSIGFRHVQPDGSVKLITLGFSTLHGICVYLYPLAELQEMFSYGNAFEVHSPSERNMLKIIFGIIKFLVEKGIIERD